jgi:uncharacterized membrane protein
MNSLSLESTLRFSSAQSFLMRHLLVDWILPGFVLVVSVVWPHSFVNATDKIVQFDRDIAPILRSHCLECHEGDNAKGGFQVNDRDALLGYVEPGNSGESSLWTDYLNQPPTSELEDSLVMPPDGPLSAEKLAVLKLWIDEGAEWPETLAISASPQPAAMETASSRSIQKWEKAYRAIGYFHPALVHFPIALFFLGGGCAFLSYFLGSRCRSMAFHCLWIAGLSSVIAVIMGWSFADLRGYPAWDKPIDSQSTHEEFTFFYHRWLGTGTAILSLILIFVALIDARSKSSGAGHIWRLGAILLAILVGIVGHQGGELVYGDIFEKAWEQFTKE